MTTNYGTRYSAASRLPYTGFNETVMLARIGHNLRDLYGNVEDEALPKGLLLMARRIDAKRRADGDKDSDN